MNSIIGSLHKMRATYAQPIAYTLLLNQQPIALNDLLDKKISLRFIGNIHCVQCHRKTNKSFQQGYCYPCYRRLFDCNFCLIHPEKCRYYENCCDTNDWAHAQCGQKHIIYVANSSGLKVGITRDTQIPTRWIDQGATQGLAIFNVANRYQAGLIEVAFKKHIADKTNWQAMLKGEPPLQDLIQKRNDLLQIAEKEIQEIMQKFPEDIQTSTSTHITDIQYPVLHYPQKITAFNLDKNPLVEGTLLGIKGQYLLLDTGVLSIRKFSGYSIELSF